MLSPAPGPTSNRPSRTRSRLAVCAVSLGCATSVLHGCDAGTDGDGGGAAAAGTSLAGIASAGIAGTGIAMGGVAGSVSPVGGGGAVSSGAGGAAAGQIAVNAGAGAGAGAPASAGAAPVGGALAGSVAAGGSTVGGFGGLAGSLGNVGGAVASGGAANAGRAGMGVAGSSGGAAASGASGASGSGGGPTHVGPWRVMHFGDSITETTCQSILTWKKLRDANRTNFDLVGSRQNQQSCNVSNPDRDCEGHGGYLVTDLVGNGKYASQLPQWLTADRAEIVLMHFGTNDVWNDIPPATILNAYTGVVGALRQVNPNVIIFVAQIIPMNPSGCGQCASRVTALNAQIPAWATAQSTGASPISVVDQWTGFDTASDTGDGVHPNIAGAQKMADKWAAALIARNLF